MEQGAIFLTLRGTPPGAVVLPLLRLVERRVPGDFRRESHWPSLVGAAQQRPAKEPIAGDGDRAERVRAETLSRGTPPGR